MKKETFAGIIIRFKILAKMHLNFQIVVMNTWKEDSAISCSCGL